MSESFDINVLREEARTRWLRPSEVYYILQNHERFPITPEPPKKPPSGSLFLYNRRVNRYFRRDGHAWLRKKDGRTVGEFHERLKVGNVDALHCYYAHGEQNPCFQRRCFWMLEPAYEHIVLVQYRETAEGRYYSSQLSNGPPESLSSSSYRNAIHGNQYHSSASGISEGSESHQSYSNLSSLTEVTSYSVNKERNRDSVTLLSMPELEQTCLEQNSEYHADNGNTANKSGLDVALKKIVEQLNLCGDDDEYISQRSAKRHGGTEDKLSMEDSLAAVRNASQAAARMVAQKGQQKTAQLRGEYGMAQEDIDELAAASRSYHQTHASSGQSYVKAAVTIQKKYKGWKGRKNFLNMRRSAVKIQVGIRGHQMWKHYSTHGSAVTDELGIANGIGVRVFSEPEACSKYVESDAAEVTRVVKRQKLDKNVRNSTFTEEDSFYPRHKNLHSKVEKPHSTFCENVKEWIAIKKRYEGGPHHTCVQQAVCKLIGRNDIEQMIMEKILSERNDESNYTVICINAGRGHGKTSLLRILYNDQQLMDSFDKRIWIQMSNKLGILMLFRNIVEFTMNDHCSITNLGYLQEMVEEEFTDKKVLLFLDDADIEDQQFWNSVLKVLNASARGSVVVMATRNATVADLTGGATHSYFLKPLSEENNLMLLQQYAALGTDFRSNPELMMVAERLVSMFGDNPLNLKAIGGLLCHTDSISIQNDMFEGSVMPLQLCYDVLQIHLKKCLAFCSLFPEGYIFDRHHIILLWISNGCIRPVEGCELEDVGAKYFNDLLCMSFFQHSPFHSDEDEKFVMHELIYKVVESVSRDKYFKSEDLLNIPENTLHLSIAPSKNRTVQLMSITEELKDLKTFLVVKPDWQQYKVSFPTLKLIDLDNFFLKFTSLEALDLSHTDVEELPGSIFRMRNLQYLSLNNTSIRALPSELYSLNNMRTLKAKDCRFLTKLHGDTKKLFKLRHLDVTKELGYVHLPHGIGELTELRTLPVFHASEDPSHCCITELGNLQSLRGSIRLSGLECIKTGRKAIEVNLKDKQHIRDVTLQWHDGGLDIEDDEAENVAEQVLEGLQPHANLQELAIRGYEGSAVPAWMQSSFSLPSLVSLTIDGCCNCTQFPAIDQLPSLKFLSIRKMYYIQQLSSDINGGTKFPSLELLNLWEMYGLEELFEASEGDCPRLRKICVSRCPDLKRLPCIPSVNELVLHCCHQLPDIPGLRSLASMKIDGFHGVKSFSLTPAALPVLKKLEIKSCNELSSVHGMEALTTIQRLKIAGCPKLVLPRTSGLAS